MRNPYRLAALTLTAAFVLGPVLASNACATDLTEVWQAAWQNDRDVAVARAAQAAAQPRRDQAAALWRPQVGVTATLGLASNQTEARGAQFSAPGLGTSAGVGFNTSVDNGTAARWAVSAVQPLYNPQRRVQQQQLTLSTDLADVEWALARQTLMLRTAQRYFDLALAEESLRVLELQLAAVQRAATEADDRFKLGSIPVTDTQEAKARVAAIRAQVVAARTELELKRGLLADSTGLAAAALVTRLPTERTGAAAQRPMDQWLADADSANPGILMRRLAATIAAKEASKFSLRASPSVDLVAQAGRDRLSGSGDYGSAGNTSANRIIGVQVSIPLFTGGWRDAKEDEARRLADKAEAEVAQTRQQVAQEVRSAWLNLAAGSERLQALAEGLTASQARRDATALGQQIGHRTTQDLLNAENDSAAARLALAQARVGVVIERLHLAALAGQLDAEALRQTDGELAPAAVGADSVSTPSASLSRRPV